MTVVKGTRRIELPTEEGQWIEVLPLTMHRAHELAWRVTKKKVKGIEPQGALDEECLVSTVVAWSYPEPVTRENILSLDVRTATFLLNELVAPLRMQAKAEDGQ